MKSNDDMKKDAIITVRLPAAIKAALQREAKADMRTVASLTAKVLAEHVVKAGYASPSKRVGNSTRRKET